MQKTIPPPNRIETRLRLGKGLLKRLGDRLLEDGMITEDQLKQGLARQSTSGEFLGEAVVSLGYITPGQIGPYMEEVTGFPFFDLAEQRIDDEVAQIIPETVCVSRRVIPFRVVKGRVHVAMADPLNLSIVDEIRSSIDQPVVPYLAFPNDVEEAIRRAFGGKTKAQAVLEEMRDESERVAASETIEQLIGMAEDAPIVRLVALDRDGCGQRGGERHPYGAARGLHSRPVPHRRPSLRADEPAAARSARDDVSAQDHVEPGHRGKAASARRPIRDARG